MQKIEYLLVLLSFTLLAGIGCHKQSRFATPYFAMNILPKWSIVKDSSEEYTLKRDTFLVKIRVVHEGQISNSLFRSPEEYITTENTNILSGFAFLDSNTIYTTKEYVNYVRKSVQKDSSGKSYSVRENTSPVIRRYLKVQDTTKSFEGIDYLCEFVYNDQSTWLPVSLPEYYKNFKFHLKATNDHYKKFYYPKTGRTGKIGFIYHSYRNNYTLTMISNLVDGSSPLVLDLIKILSSVQITRE
jgi:hypothetical protein